MNLLLAASPAGNTLIVQARIRVIDLDDGRVIFDWLDAKGKPVGLGLSVAVIDASIFPTAKSVEAAIMDSTAATTAVPAS